MKSIHGLANYFGYYKSNSEFESVINQLLTKPSNYSSQTLYIVCKKTKIEIGFTNERMIRKEDENKPIMGGKPIFTHFNIYSQSEHLFEELPFGILFSDKQQDVRNKAGEPAKSIDRNTPILGWNKSDYYELPDSNLDFHIKYNPADNSIEYLQISQREKIIVEESQPKI
ncbi:MAG: hypothetical protein K0S32_1554 [Bacteroidetes bacterium]|jgi:hypothetical protein|nr:hypothetical protein [Bacteroidota bacterium]